MHWSMNNRWSFVEVRYRLLAFWRKYDCARCFSSHNRCGRHLFKSYLSISNLFLMCLDDLWSCPSEGPLCYTHNSPLSNEMRSLRTSPQDTHLRTLHHVTIQHRYACQGDIDQSFDFRSVRHANLQIWYIPLSQNSSAASRWNFDNHLSNMLLTDEMFICFLGLVEWENLVDDGPDLSSFEKPVHLFESWRAC